MRTLTAPKPTRSACRAISCCRAERQFFVQASSESPRTATSTGVERACSRATSIAVGLAEDDTRVQGLHVDREADVGTGCETPQGHPQKEERLRFHTGEGPASTRPCARSAFGTATSGPPCDRGPHPPARPATTIGSAAPADAARPRSASPPHTVGRSSSRTRCRPCSGDRRVGS